MANGSKVLLPLCGFNIFLSLKNLLELGRLLIGRDEVRGIHFLMPAHWISVRHAMSIAVTSVARLTCGHHSSINSTTQRYCKAML